MNKTVMVILAVLLLVFFTSTTSSSETPIDGSTVNDYIYIGDNWKTYIGDEYPHYEVEVNGILYDAYPLYYESNPDSSTMTWYITTKDGKLVEDINIYKNAAFTATVSHHVQMGWNGNIGTLAYDLEEMADSLENMIFLAEAQKITVLLRDITAKMLGTTVICYFTGGACVADMSTREVVKKTADDIILEFATEYVESSINVDNVAKYVIENEVDNASKDLRKASEYIQNKDSNNWTYSDATVFWRYYREGSIKGLAFGNVLVKSIEENSLNQLDEISSNALEGACNICSPVMEISGKIKETNEAYELFYYAGEMVKEKESLFEISENWHEKNVDFLFKYAIDPDKDGCLLENDPYPNDNDFDGDSVSDCEDACPGIYGILSNGCNNPDFGFNDYVIIYDSDGDSIPEPGEHIKMTLKLNNYIDAPYSNLFAIVSTQESDITITQNRITFGEQDVPFEFTIRSDFVGEVKFDIDLHYTNSLNKEEKKTFSFIFNVKNKVGIYLDNLGIYSRIDYSGDYCSGWVLYPPPSEFPYNGKIWSYYEVKNAYHNNYWEKSDYSAEFYQTLKYYDPDGNFQYRNHELVSDLYGYWYPWSCWCWCYQSNDLTNVGNWKIVYQLKDTITDEIYKDERTIRITENIQPKLQMEISPAIDNSDQFLTFIVKDNSRLTNLTLYYKETQSDVWKTKHIKLSGTYFSDKINIGQFQFGEKIEFYGTVYDWSGNSYTTEIEKVIIRGIKVNNISITNEIEYGTPFTLSINITTNDYGGPIFAGIRGGSVTDFSYRGDIDISYNKEIRFPETEGYTFRIFEPISKGVNDEVNIIVNISYIGADRISLLNDEIYNDLSIGTNNIEAEVYSWIDIPYDQINARTQGLPFYVPGSDNDPERSNLAYLLKLLELNVLESNFDIENVEFPSLFKFSEDVQYMNVSLFNGGDSPINGFDLIIYAKDVKMEPNPIDIQINNQSIYDFYSYPVYLSGYGYIQRHPVNSPYNPYYILKSDQTLNPFTSAIFQIPVKVNIKNLIGSYIDNPDDIIGSINFEIRAIPHEKTKGIAYNTSTVNFIYKTPIVGELSLIDSISQIDNHSISEGAYQICNFGSPEFCRIILENTDFYYNLTFESPVNGTNISITLETLRDGDFELVGDSAIIYQLDSISANETINVSFKLRTKPKLNPDCGFRGDTLTTQSRSSHPEYYVKGKFWSEEYNTYFNIEKGVQENIYILPKPKLSDIYFFKEDNGSFNNNKPISNISIGDTFYVVMDETEFPWYDDCLYDARYHPDYYKLWQSEYYNTRFHLIAPNTNDSIRFISGNDLSIYYGDFNYESDLPSSLPYKYAWKFKATGAGVFPIRAYLSYNKEVDGQNPIYSIQKNRTIKVLRPPELYLERINFNDPIIREPGIHPIEYKVYNLGEATAENIRFKVKTWNPDGSIYTAYYSIDDVQPGWYQYFNLHLNVSSEGIYTLYIFNDENNQLLEKFQIAYHNPDGKKIFEQTGTYIEKYQERSFDLNISNDYEKFKVEWWGTYSGDNIALKLVSPSNTEYNLGSAYGNSHIIKYLGNLEKGLWKVKIYCASTNHYRCLDYFCYNKLYYTYTNVKINGISAEPNPLPAITIATSYYGKGDGMDPGTHLVVSANVSNSFTEDIIGYITPDLPLEYYKGNLTEDYVGVVPHNPDQYGKTWDYRLSKAGIIPITISFRDLSGNYYNRTVIVNVPGYSSLMGVSPTDYYNVQPGNILNFSLWLRDWGGSSSIDIDTSTFDNNNWITNIESSRFDLKDYEMIRINFNVTVPQNVSPDTYYFAIRGHPIGHPAWIKFYEIIRVEVKNKTIEISKNLSIDSIQLAKEEIFTDEVMPITVNIVDALNNPINIGDLPVRIIKPDNRYYNVSLTPSEELIGNYSGIIDWIDIAGTYTVSIYSHVSNFSFNQTCNISFEVYDKILKSNFTIYSNNRDQTIIPGEDTEYYFSIQNSGQSIDNYTNELCSIENAIQLTLIQNLNWTTSNFNNEIYSNDCENYTISLKNLTLSPGNIEDLYLYYNGTVPGEYNCTVLVNSSSINSAFYRTVNFSTTVLRPDISFVEDCITFYPDEFYSGNNLTVLVRLNIIGKIFPKRFNVSLYDGNPNFEGINIKSKVFEPSNILREEVSMLFSFIPINKTYDLYLIIDEDDFINESNEDNNIINTTIIVLENLSPIANFTFSPENPVIYQNVIFNASSSYDLDGQIVSYEWEFGDENITKTIEPIITHFFTSTNNYNVNLTVTDNVDRINSTIRLVKISLAGISVDLHTGWNIISLPLMSDDTSITSILSPINGNYSIIWAYNASDTADHWKKYDPATPFGNDLTTMESGNGYWIMMTSDDIFNISGTMPELTDIELWSGWNLIGYNSLNPQTITDALSSINGNYSIIWAYNASDSTYHWEKYNPNTPFGNDLENMEPGKGYWIMMTTDDILKI